MPQVGQKIGLRLYLWDGATDKHVRAYLYTFEDSFIGQVTLAHVGNGLYTNRDISMPSSREVRAIYRVYDDLQASVPSLNHQDALDIFQIEIGTGSSFYAGELVGEVIEAKTLIGAIEDMNDTTEALLR